MDESSFEVPATALRVFVGYRRADLPDAQFRKLLGNAFMPGTPYMLQPLGLSAYLPGIFEKSTPTVEDLPDEFAIIAYPSAERWHEIMNDTLRGRVYNQTHGGVYESKSHAQFPHHVDDAAATAGEAYFLFDVAIDWQRGHTGIFIIEDAPAKVREALLRASASLTQAGIDQCIVTTGQAWAIVWMHHPSAEPAWPVAEDELTILAAIPARRVICVDEPPVVSLSGTMALNFIFLRAAEHFLR